MVVKLGSKRAEEQFAIGDTVFLKSGGALMTVCRVVAGDVYCIWHGAGGQPCGGRYDPQVLRKAAPAAFPAHGSEEGGGEELAERVAPRAV